MHCASSEFDGNIVNIIERVWKMESRDKRTYCLLSCDSAFDAVFTYRNTTERKLNEAENITFDNFLCDARSELLRIWLWLKSTACWNRNFLNSVWRRRNIEETP